VLYEADLLHGYRMIWQTEILFSSRLNCYAEVILVRFLLDLVDCSFVPFFSLLDVILAYFLIHFIPRVSHFGINAIDMGYREAQRN
jgi:hypothetical protein